MESKAKIVGHPAHPIMIVFPLGLLATSVIFDLVYILTDNSTFVLVSYWMIVAGLISGLAAAVPGWIDWFAIPRNTRAKRVGLIHGLGNVGVLLLFAVSWLLRRDVAGFEPSTWALIFSVAGFGLAGLTGWLGGELVDRLGVGVDDGAHLDAPNSLTGRPAAAVDPDELAAIRRL